MTADALTSFPYFIRDTPLYEDKTSAVPDRNYPSFISASVFFNSLKEAQLLRTNISWHNGLDSHV